MVEIALSFSRLFPTPSEIFYFFADVVRIGVSGRGRALFFSRDET